MAWLSSVDFSKCVWMFSSGSNLWISGLWPHSVLSNRQIDPQSPTCCCVSHLLMTMVRVAGLVPAQALNKGRYEVVWVNDGEGSVSACSCDGTDRTSGGRRRHLICMGSLSSSPGGCSNTKHRLTGTVPWGRNIQGRVPDITLYFLPNWNVLYLKRVPLVHVEHLLLISILCLALKCY